MLLPQLSHPQEEVLVILNQDRTLVIPRRGFDDVRAQAVALGTEHLVAFSTQVKRQMDLLSLEILPTP